MTGARSVLVRAADEILGTHRASRQQAETLPAPGPAPGIPSRTSEPKPRIMPSVMALAHP